MSRSARRSPSPATRAFVAVLVGLVLLPAAARPDDPLVSQQGHHEQVHTFQAWDVRRGEGAVVAVLDTGVDLDHPDLAGRLVDGIDLIEPDTPPDDPQGHGTIVAGVIAAVAGNGRGVAGVAPQAQIMPIRVLDAEGSGTSDVVAAGIRHAIEMEVQVINLSLAEVNADEGEEGQTNGGAGAPSLLGVSLVQDREVVQAIQEAAEAGIMVVAAAGNDGLDRTPYNDDVPVVVVGATDTEGVRWEESNHDDRTLFAPGTEILSTWSEGRYAKSDGTSFATPIVAAGAAMLLGAGLDLEEATNRLIDTAVPLEDGEGLGLLDLAAAVQGLDPAPPTTPPPPAPPTTPPATTAPPAPTTPAPTATDGLEAAEPVTEVAEPQPQPATVTEPPPAIVTTAPPQAVVTAPATPLPAAELEPAQAVTVPPTATPTTTPPPIGVESGTADARAAAMTVATVLLGADVLLAGWVLAGRKP